MGASERRVAEIREIFLRSRGDWRTVFYELESGEASYFDDPWRGIDDFLETCEEQERGTFRTTLVAMIEEGEAAEQAQALAIVGACQSPFEMADVLAIADRLRQSLEVHLELLLVIGQRDFAPGRPLVEQALEDRRCRHAAAIALAQLDPNAAGKLGKEFYEADRERILAALQRPLSEQDYATFYQMALGVLEVRGKDGLNDFLRAVAGGDEARRHEMAQVVRRLMRQEQAHDHP